jgi:dihydropteroate synthase
MGTLTWRCGERVFDLTAKPVVMGILNVTPDSFSDGGRFVARDAALAAAEAMLADGADILDVGGESTRPGATPVTLDDELSRVLPVLEGLRDRRAVVSVDTMKAAVAAAALERGATILNDVSGFRDPAMIEVARQSEAGLVVMHMPGTPQTMNDSPSYSDIVAEVIGYLQQQTQKLLDAGIARHSLTILANLDAFRVLGFPIVLGVSRKGFIGRITGRETDARMPGSLAIASFALALGTADILRVHDVSPTVDAVKLHIAQAKYRQPFHRDSL